jgi:hypothetical protein
VFYKSPETVVMPPGRVSHLQVRSEGSLDFKAMESVEHSNAYLSIGRLALGSETAYRRSRRMS